MSDKRCESHSPADNFSARRCSDDKGHAVKSPYMLHKCGGMTWDDSGNSWMGETPLFIENVRIVQKHRPRSLNIYVASSWRNQVQASVVDALRGCGHDVYDFKHPAPGNDGFSWKQTEPEYAGGPVSLDTYKVMLAHPIAEQGYGHDIGALRRCNVVVYVLPCGKSASWEFGYAMGQGKRGYVFTLEPTIEPELMFREATIVTSLDELTKLFTDVYSP